MPDFSSWRSARPRARLRRSPGGAGASNVAVTGTVTDGSGHGWPLYARIEITSASTDPVVVYSDPVTGAYAVELRGRDDLHGGRDGRRAGYAAGGGTVVTAGAPVVADWTLGRRGPVQRARLRARHLRISGPLRELRRRRDSAGLERRERQPGRRALESCFRARIPADFSTATARAVRDRMRSSTATATIRHGRHVPGDGADRSLVERERRDPVGQRPDRRRAGRHARRRGRLDRRRSDLDERLASDAGRPGTGDPDGGHVVRGGPRRRAGALPLQRVLRLLVAGRRRGDRARSPARSFRAASWSATSRDANTGVGLNGATVTALADGSSTTTVASPGQGDGFYSLFVAGSGSQDFEASAALHTSLTKNAAVAANAVVRLDFALPAGLLDAGPRPLSAVVSPGGTQSVTLDVSNIGTGDGTFALHEVDVAPAAAPAPSKPAFVLSLARTASAAPAVHARSDRRPGCADGFAAGRPRRGRGPSRQLVRDRSRRTAMASRTTRPRTGSGSPIPTRRGRASTATVSTTSTSRTARDRRDHRRSRRGTGRATAPTTRGPG